MTSTGDGTGQVVGAIITTQTWDDSSRLVRQTDDNGNSTGYAYDALNRRTGTTYADGTSEQYAYGVLDDVLTVIDPNGTGTSTRYDLLGRALLKSIARGPGILGTNFEIWRYDGLSRVIYAQDDDSVVTRGYDSLSNLTVETQKIGTGPTRTLTATFDGVGNRTLVTYPSGRVVGYFYDNLDRIQYVSREWPAAREDPVPALAA
jgi:YD repeat-containing protein